MYKFQSRASGDVLMLNPVADQLLALMGRAPAVQGIFEVSALPAAIEALQQAVEADDALRVSLARAMDGPEPALDEQTAPLQAISLRRRAWPLVELFKRSLAENQPVLWGV